MRIDHYPLWRYVEDFLAELRAKRRRSTVEKYNYILRGFVRCCDGFGVHRPQDITRELWLRYLSGLREGGLREWTIRTNALAVKAFLDWLLEERFLPEPIVRARDIPRPPRPEPAPFTVEELERILRALKKDRTWLGLRNYAMTLCLLSTGLRRSELLQMTVGMVRERIITVRQKGDRRLRTYLDGETQAAILRYLRAYERETGDRLEEYEHVWRDANKRPLSPNAVDIFYRRLGKRLRMRVHPHRFRATSISWRLEMGASTELVRSLIGHEHPQAIQHYARFSEAERARLAEATNPLKKLKDP